MSKTQIKHNFRTQLLIFLIKCLTIISFCAIYVRANTIKESQICQTKRLEMCYLL